MIWAYIGFALSITIAHIQGHKKVDPDKVLVLIKSSLWQNMEARTYQDSTVYKCMM